MRRKNYAFIKRTLIIAGIGTFTVLLTGCKSSHSTEAAIVAKNGSNTANALADYFHELATQASEMATAKAMEVAILNPTIEPNDANITATIQKYSIRAANYTARETVARKIKSVYDEFDKLAEAKPDDVIGAVSNLESAVEDLNSKHNLQVALAGHPIDNTLIDNHLKKLESYLIDMAKTKKIANANSDSMNALQELLVVLREEDPIYTQDAAEAAQEAHALAQLLAGTDPHQQGTGWAMVDIDVLGAHSPIDDLLQPYNFQPAKTDALGNATRVAVKYKIEQIYIEQIYQNARRDAVSQPKSLEADINAQIQRQAAFKVL